MENWTRIKTETVYSGYRKVEKVTFELPDGRQEDFDVFDEDTGVCVLALTEDNQVVLAKQFRPGPEKVLLEMPGGGYDSDETPLEAAKRELLEETGYTGDFQFVCKSFHSAYSTFVRHNFVATNCKKVAELANDRDEFTEPVLLSLEDFRKHLQTGQLTDMGTGYRCLDFLGLL